MLMRYQALLTIVALNPVQPLTSQLSPVEASTNVFSVCTLGEHFTLSYAFKLLDAFLAKSLFFNDNVQNHHIHIQVWLCVCPVYIPLC